MSEPNYMAIWYEALGNDFGVVYRTTDRERFRAKLYAARREACDASLETLSIVFSPTDSSEVWIIHNDKETPSGALGEGDASPVRE